MLTILLISIAVANVSNASNISHQNIIVQEDRVCSYEERYNPFMYMLLLRYVTSFCC